MIAKFFLLICTISFFHTVKSQVVITGSATNHKDTFFFVSETGGFHNYTKVWRDKRVKVIIDHAGKFKCSVSEEDIGSWYVTSTDNKIQVFELIKGENLQVILDFSRQTPLVAFGKNASDFNYTTYITRELHKYYNETKRSDKIKTKNIDSALYNRKLLSQFKIKQLERYRQTQPTMSSKYFQWLNSKYKYEPYERTVVEDLNSEVLDKLDMAKIMENGISDDYAALHTAEYNHLIDLYIEQHVKTSGRQNMTIVDRFNVVADTNILIGITKEVYLTRFLSWAIKTPDSLFTRMFSKYETMVHSEILNRSVMTRLEEKLYSDQSSLIYPNHNGGSLSFLLRRYKGSVIYVDFWASWCVPCRAEMANAAKLKKSLAGKTVVFLYFGYKDKEKAWLKAREEMSIEGEHFMLSEQMTKEADELFGINGIPHYAIIDKKGTIINKRADRPSDVFAELLSLSER